MKMINKRGVAFDKMLIAFIVFSLFIFGGTLMMIDLNDNYGEFGVNMTTDDFGEVYNTTEEIFGITRDVDDKTFQGDVAEIESADSTIRGSYSVLRLMGGTYSMFSAITNAIADKIGIHEILIKSAFAVFSLIILFSVIYMVFRFRP